jgi:NDP-sugar pyrophosphorylase family protein
MLPIAILAGGLATRLGFLSKDTPKSLIPINGDPFIFHQLKLLKKNGAEKIVLCLGHMGDKIKKAVGDGKNFGLKICYSYDGPVLLGTGGAIVNALPLLSDLFMIMYGDSYLDINLNDVAKEFMYSGKPGLMTVYKNQNLYDKSNVIYNNGIIELYRKNIADEKMDYVDYGISCFNKNVFTKKGKIKFDLSEILTELSILNELAGYEVNKRFYEIGSESGIAELENFLSNAEDIL